MIKSRYNNKKDVLGMTTAEKIKALRKSFGFTQTELGEKLGVKKNAVSKWETGRVDDIPASKLKAMAALFDVQVSYLVDNENADDELQHYLESLKNRPEMRMLFKLSDNCTKEEVEQAVRIIEALRHG